MTIAARTPTLPTQVDARPRPAPASSRVKGTVASDHLNMIRGLAAVVVLCHHARPQLFGAFRDSLRDYPLGIPLFVSTRFGHTAVIIFFVLSGLLVGGGVVESVGAGRWSWKDYLARRLARLYVVLIPVVVITLTLDRSWVEWSAGLPPPAGASEINPRVVIDRSTPGVVAGNLLFLQNVCVPTLGGNIALWSLSNEFWYYAIFPCLWLAASGGQGSRRRAALGTAAAAMLVFVGGQVAFHFLIWLAGVGLYAAPLLPWLHRNPGRARAAAAVAAVPLATVIGLMAVRKLPDGGWASDLLVGLTFDVLLYFVLHLTQPSHAGRYARFAAWIAGFSYSLYLLHMPLLLALRSWLTYEAVWEPDLAHLLAGLGVLLAVIGLAYAFSLLTEAKTDAIRRALMRHPGRRARTGVLAGGVGPGAALARSAGAPLEATGSDHPGSIVTP
jgi:peptidoglycan/LPS O-acetylase OafA/YrhL